MSQISTADAIDPERILNWATDLFDAVAAYQLKVQARASDLWTEMQSDEGMAVAAVLIKGEAETLRALLEKFDRIYPRGDV